jgi:hypothetical protein
MHFRGAVDVVGAESDPEPADGKNHRFDSPEVSDPTTSLLASLAMSSRSTR